jgi:succinyl-CoA synthetase beta subunit
MAQNTCSSGWADHIDADGESQVISEHVVARILEAAGLPVAAGHLANTEQDAVRAALEVGFPVAMKGISSAITHRAAAGLVVLNVNGPDEVIETDRALRARAARRGVTLDGTWVQHMFRGDRELLVTAFRDREFGVMVGCGVGGGMTEIVDDVAFARAPIDDDGAFNLLARLRTIRRLPEWISIQQQQRAAVFIARFSALVATAAWERFTFEINPLKLSEDDLAAVDGLLVIE